MIRHIFNVKSKEIATTRSYKLLAQSDIEDLELILRERRLRWYGHVERSSGAVKVASELEAGKRKPGGQKKTWKQLTKDDCRKWGLLAVDPHDRSSWRSGVRSAMRAASWKLHS